MNNQNLIIYDFIELFSILNEIKNNLNFKLLNISKKELNDLKLDNGFGTCGKSGQMVPVGLGIPSCKVSMTVGGSKI